MSDDSHDRDLGMDRKITRRDFLNGVSNRRRRISACRKRSRDQRS